MSAQLFLIHPSPILVTITPDTLASGDTASIIIKKRNPDGTIVDFPDDQFLEVGMLTGCLSGAIVGCYDGNCYQDTYFSDVWPTDSVYFVADSAADSGTVKIRVGIVDYGGGISAGVAAQDRSARFKKIGKEKPKVAMKKNRSVEEKAAFIKDVKSRINNSALSVSEKQKMVEKLNILTSTNTESSECHVGFIGTTPANKNVVIGEKCQEEIIYASSNEAQRLSADTSEIILLRDGDIWSWTDKDGNPYIANITDPCIHFGKDAKGGTGFLFLIRGTSKNWVFSNEYKIIPLLDAINKSAEEYRWIFNIENLKIPILSDYCFDPTDINLKDGSDTLLLAQHINNLETFKLVMKDLEILREGAYRHLYDTLETPFIYLPGIQAHEYHHYLKDRENIAKELNERTFPSIREIKLSKSNYACPEDALNKEEYEIKIKMIRGIVNGTDLEKIYGKQKVFMKKGNVIIEEEVKSEELYADDYARPFYDAVYNRLKYWAERQPWYSTD